MSPRTLLPLLAALLAAAPAAAARAEWLGYRGEARDPSAGSLLYIEEHWLREGGDGPAERVVVYRCPSGEAFARKRVDYAVSRLAPAFLLEDGRDGYLEGLLRAERGAELVVRRGNAEPERRARVDEAGLVADAGFDEFIRSQWDRLVGGESVELRFAIPARQDAMRFRVRHLGSGEADGRPVERFRLRLGGVIGWVAPQIDVTYAANDRQLLSYAGLSNLRDPRGRQWVASIQFPHAPAPAAPAAVEAAASEPLVACG